MIDFLKVIAALRPGVPVSVNGDVYGGITMLDGSTKPTLAQCTAKWTVMLEEIRVAKIDAEILALEKQAIDQGLLRTIIDDLLIRSLQVAEAGGVSKAQLLNPQDPSYSKAFEKVNANAEARAALRAQR